MTRKAFTLIELLVVISIISILISILLPALGKARESAKGLQCMAKIKAMGVAMSAYVLDHDGWYPAGAEYSTWTQTPDAPGPTTSWDQGWGWPEAIYDYMTHPGAYNPDAGDGSGVTLYTCPSDPKEQIYPGDGNLSYVMNGQRDNGNARWDGMTYKNSGETRLPIGDVPSNAVHVRDRWVMDPSGTFVVVDNCSPQYRGSWRYAASAQIRSPVYPYGTLNYNFRLIEGKMQNHNGAFNWLFADGHAKSLTVEATINSNNLARPFGIWTKTRGD